MRLSYSRVSTYKQCPFLYYLEYERGARRPFTAAISFGSSLHMALQGFHTLPTHHPRLEQLFRIYTERWLPYGYRSPNEQARYFERGFTILGEYYRRNLFGFTPALFVEKRFTVELAGWPFTGIADRIDGPRDCYRVIDYKSSRHPETMASMQLPLYQLSLEKALGHPPERTLYYFLSEQEEAVRETSREELEVALEMVAKTGEGIRAERFQRNQGAHCKRCDFRRACAHEPEPIISKR